MTTSNKKEPQESVATRSRKKATQPPLPEASAESSATESADVLDPREPEVFADTNQGLVKVENTALAAYGEREVVRELVSRLLKFHPAAKEVGMPGMIMAAQLAILMGASPIPGTNEIHIWRDNRGNIIVAPGINYWERRARQQGGVFWDIEPRPMTEDEKRMYRITPNDLAAICRGVRLADLTDWIGKGLPPEAALRGFGRIGLGVCSTRTYSWKDEQDFSERKQGRPLIWTAIKRARTDCLKNLFPVIPGERVEGGPGMALGKDGAYRPVYDSHWVALDAKIIDDEPIPGELTDEDKNEFLWGSSLGIGDSMTSDAFLSAKDRSITDATGSLAIDEELEAESEAEDA